MWVFLVGAGFLISFRVGLLGLFGVSFSFFIFLRLVGWVL